MVFQMSSESLEDIAIAIDCAEPSGMAKLLYFKNRTPRLEIAASMGAVQPAQNSK